MKPIVLTCFRPTNPCRLRRRHRPQHAASSQHHLRYRWMDTSHHRRSPPRCCRSSQDAHGRDHWHGSVPRDRSWHRIRFCTHWKQDSLRGFYLVHLHLRFGLRTRLHIDAADLSWRGLVERHARKGYGCLPVDIWMRRIRKHLCCAHRAQECT
jgi:hypothetical protein